MVVRPDLGATQAAKEALRHIGASTVERIRLAMVDPVSLVTGVEHVPMRSLVGVDGRAGLDNSMDGLDPIAFMLADEREHVRSEERRVGKECVSTCRSRWAPYY